MRMRGRNEDEGKKCVDAVVGKISQRRNVSKRCWEEKARGRKLFLFNF